MKKHNIVMLVSDIASEFVVSEVDSNDIWKEDGTYTDKAQEIFNERCDMVYSLIDYYLKEFESESKANQKPLIINFPFEEDSKCSKK